jgi:arginase family enzyme
MALRMLIDSGDVDPADVTLLGARNLDPPEAAFIEAAGVGSERRELSEPVYVALDCDVVEPGQLDVFFPEPDGIPLAELEQMLATVPRPLGAGLTGLVDSERNRRVLPRLVHALGL